jgi:hypothetical protein
MFFTELVHGHSAAWLCRDSFGPLVCFRFGRLLLDESVAHETTMQHRPAFQEQWFTRRLQTPSRVPILCLCVPARKWSTSGKCLKRIAWTTRLELATSAVTVHCQLVTT